MTKTCPVCLSSFATKNNRQLRCSRACAGQVRPKQGKLTVPCVSCGQDFLRWPYDVQRKACSAVCRTAAKSLPRPNRRVRPDRPCATCHKPYSPKTNTQRFCSPACYADHLATVSGNAHPLWQGGHKSPRPDLSRAAWHRLRRRLISEAGHCCTQCGQPRHRLVVHHIETAQIAPERLLDESNLRVLCQACHNRIHNPVLARWRKRIS